MIYLLILTNVGSVARIKIGFLDRHPELMGEVYQLSVDQVKILEAAVPVPLTSHDPVQNILIWRTKS